MSQFAPAGGYKESDHRSSVMLARIPTAPTTITSGEEKVPQNGSFPGGRSAGGIVSTVANLLSAGDSRMDYCPQENPANHYIHGDAGGILLDVTYARRSYFEPRPRCPYFDHGPSKPSRTPLKPLPGSSTTRGAVTPCCVRQTGLYTHRCQAGRTSPRGPGIVTPATPCPCISVLTGYRVCTRAHYYAGVR
jgi:hypothetical protein